MALFAPTWRIQSPLLCMGVLLVSLLVMGVSAVSYPNSSSVIDTLIPLGVATVYKVISGEDIMRTATDSSGSQQ